MITDTVRAVVTLVMIRDRDRAVRRCATVVRNVRDEFDGCATDWLRARTPNAPLDWHVLRDDPVGDDDDAGDMTLRWRR